MKRRCMLQDGVVLLAGAGARPAHARSVRIGFLTGGSLADPSLRRNIIEPLRPACPQAVLLAADEVLR